MNRTAFLRGILRQLLEDGAITREEYGTMIRRLDEKEREEKRAGRGQNG